MTQNRTKISSTFYFVHTPAFPQLQFVGFIGVVFSFVQAILGNYPQAGFFIVLSLIMLLLRPWTRLDIKRKTLIDFFLFIPYKRMKIDQINNVRLIEASVSQVLNSRGSTSTVSFDLYKILLDTHSETIVLKESRSKVNLLKKAGQIALAASVQLVDRTSDS